MSIYNLPPLKQTFEHQSSKVDRVAHIGDRLGRESARRVIEDSPRLFEGEVIYFPTHESLEAAITYIREGELAKVDGEIEDTGNTLARIDNELAIQNDRLLAIKDYIDDLRLADTPGVAAKKFNGYSYNDTVLLIKALESAREDICEIADSLIEERCGVLAKLEAIEEQDFELLQAGR